MRAPQHLRLRASGAVLLALLGVWLGHAVEYLRVWGLGGLDRALLGPAHAYMIPLGAVLALAAALCARRAWTSWQRLAMRLDAAARSLRGALRGGASGGATAEPLTAPSWESRVLSLSTLLATAQISLYLLQENVEAFAAGQTPPGLGAVTGVHWAAALIQLDIALVLLAVAAFFVRRFQARVAEVVAVESLVHWIIRARLRPQRATVRPSGRLAAAFEWWGRASWSRPPPSVLA